jgi:hypothetical protein
MILAALSEPPASPDPMFLGMLVLGLFTLVSLADKVDSFFQRRRRQPPVDVDLGKLTASIDLLTQLNKRNEERMTAIEQKLERDIATQRAYTAKSSKDIFDRIEGVRLEINTRFDGLQQTLAQNVQTMERAIGRVEGSSSRHD